MWNRLRRSVEKWIDEEDEDSSEHVWDLTRRAFKGWSEDGSNSMGAAVASYTLLSMAPLLVLVITLAGLFIGRDQAWGLTPIFTSAA